MLKRRDGLQRRRERGLGGAHRLPRGPQGVVDAGELVEVRQTANQQLPEEGVGQRGSALWDVEGQAWFRATGRASPLCASALPAACVPRLETGLTRADCACCLGPACVPPALGGGC
jgi:hypothetical protein